MLLFGNLPQLFKHLDSPQISLKTRSLNRFLTGFVHFPYCALPLLNDITLTGLSLARTSLRENDYFVQFPKYKLFIHPLFNVFCLITLLVI